MNVEPYKKVIFAYIVSVVGVVAISIVINIRDNKDIKDSILITLVVLIPAIYSLIPALKDAILTASRSKNRLTSEMFTDRENDLKHLLVMLSSQDRKIEIKGKEESCGKTWLAMRLCDYINNPKDKSLRFSDIKIPFKRAFYLDLQNYNTEQLYNFFNTNIIVPKDVIIFDNVKDIEKLISIQKHYHFQMVYVMKDLKETDFTSHCVSKFNIENMEMLHNKIRSTYPNLDQLTKKDFDKLFELTNGNIGRIAGVLSEQKSIEWLKDISNGAKTEYDIELDKIQIELFVGHYKTAEEKLDNFKVKYSDAMGNILDINYKYLLILSDCKHLLNNYADALNILSLIETKDYQVYNKNNEIALHKAHYCKHLWRCDEALDILRSIKEVSYSAIVDSLGILAAKYFINDLHVDFSDKSSIEVYKEYYTFAKNSNLAHNQSDSYKLMRHTAVYEYYTHSNLDLFELISHINKIITIYKAENNRLLANAYFIQGEIYRLYKEYDSAIVSYKNCLNITHDNNIIIQVNLMVYYLKFIKKQNLDFVIINDETINKICECNNYADKLYRRIKCIELNDFNANEIITCFDTRIMPIL